ncbi:serine hydrolase [Qipengyuania sp. JC766]|uniref:serine hydrolase domain-containing protein n=1 Tax=Qipengyuania sp. JC766 TaxID=3232139 RepID=UPI003458CAB5
MKTAVKAALPVFALLLVACDDTAIQAAKGTEEAAEQEPDLSAEPVATQGLHQPTLDRAIGMAEALPQLNGMVIMRDGETLLERRFNDGAPLDRAVNIKSASKSVLSALVGIAIERGVLDGTDQPVVSVLSADAPADPDPRLARLTVGNLLSMQAGLERTSGANYGAWVSSRDWVADALGRPFVDEPGGRMLYSTGNTHLLSAMLTRASGRDTLSLAREWLGAPLGISIPAWATDPEGIYFGGNDMRMSPRDLARFGELYRNDGVLDDTRILPEGWVAQSWTPRAVSPWSGEDYGYGWFVSESGDHPLYYGWGYGGQMVYVLPSLELTVVMTSDIDAERGSDHIGALRRVLDEGIVPAAERGAA